jgi:hypothetical protein
MTPAARSTARRSAHWLLAGVVVLALATLTFQLAPWMQEAATPARPAPRKAPTELEDLLARLQKAWRPDEHRRVLLAAAADAESCRRELPEFLLRGKRALLRPALELAGFLRVSEALPAIQKLALRRDLRLPALAAADAIEPLPEAVLDELLADDDEGVVLAALAIAARRNPPLADVIDLLAHDNDRIAEAAMASLPARLPATLKPALEALGRHERPEVAARAFRALLRIEADEDPARTADAGPEANAHDGQDRPAPRSREELTRALDAGDTAARIDALQELSRSPWPEDTELVLGLLLHANPDAVRKQACVFLGQVRSRRAVRPLIDALADGKDEGLRANAHWALQRITGQQLRRDAGLWEEWWDRCGPRFTGLAAPPR